MRNADRRRLDEYLNEVRRELFGHPDPPFSTKDEAESWLRRESERGISESGSEERSRDFQRRFQALTGEVRALGRQAPRGVHVELGLRREMVSFESSREQAVCSVAATTKPLLRVAEAARDGASFGDVSEQSITMRLLTGTGLPTRREHKRYMNNPIGSRITTSVSADPDVRKWFLAIDKRKLKLRDREFLRFMFALEDDGVHPPGVPGRQGKNAGVRRYWEDILQRWNAEHEIEDWHLGHWTSAQRLYTRLTTGLPERPAL